jgi:DNA polymerase III delta subunit
MKHESSPQKAAPQLGASPYYLKKCQEKGRNFSEEELKKYLSLLLQADLDLKSGKEQLTVLELLLTSLCGK